jgi:hypothetical protein
MVDEEAVMTDEELQQARRLVEAAIVGPWSHKRYDKDPINGPNDVVLDANAMWVADIGDDPSSAAFIATSRALVPRLLDEIDRLRERHAQEEACADTVDAGELLERYDMLTTAYREEVARVEKLRTALKEMAVFAKAVAGGQAYERMCALAKIADTL